MTLEYMEHTPLTETEALGLLDKGIYKAFIKKIEIKFGSKDVTKKFFVATVEVCDKYNKPHTIVVWLALPYLLKHMYECTGNAEKYQGSKLLPSDCENCRVGVNVGIQEPTEKYPRTKNVILDFVNLPGEQKTFNDAIPF